MSRSIDTLSLLIAPEDRIGVPYPPTKKLTTLGISFDAEVRNQFFRPRGKKHRTSGVKHREWVTGSFESGLDFNELTYLFDMLYGKATPTQIGSLAAYSRSWTSSNLPVTPQSFTVKEGDTVASELVSGLLATSLTMNVDTEQSSASGNVIGSAIRRDMSPVGSVTDEVQKITPSGTISGGTFTLTYSTQTTSAIPYNATAAEIQAALWALSNIADGDVIVVGGPLPTYPVYVFFQGLLKQTNVGLITDTESLTGGGTLTESELVAGATAYTSIARQPIGVNQWDVFFNDTYASIASSKTCRALELELNVPEKLSPTFALCTDYPSIYDYVESNQEGLVSRITVRNESDMIAMLATWDTTQKPTKYVRWQAQGALIGTNASTPVYYLLQVDYAAQIDTVRDRRNISSIYAKDINVQIVDDDTLGGAVKFTLINSLASI